MSEQMSIADDYRENLEILQSPDRFAINNLTVIAKENSDHADVIAEVLVEHIKKVPPHYKLPALYVLDSIAKNIGSSYTRLLGDQLYVTFMNAYSSVDQTTRRKMDEMLKTWKSPIPGAVDTRPVFPGPITKRIEDALIRARTVALKHDQNNALAYIQKRPGSAIGAQQWRNTPTPPQTVMGYPPPNAVQYNQQMPPGYPQMPVPGYPNGTASGQYYQQAGPSPGYGQYQQPQQPHPSASPFPQYPTPQQPPAYQAPTASGHDLHLLNQDIEQLITNCRQEFSVNTQDTRKMGKLQALLSLQRVINTQQLPMDQFASVRKQVDELQAADRREQAERQPFQPMPPQPPAPTPLQNLLTQINKPQTAPPPAPPQDPRQHLPPPPDPRAAAPNLASLLANIGPLPPALPNLPPPPPPGFTPRMQNSTIPPPAAATDYSSLLASLTKSALGANATPQPSAPVVPPPAPAQPAAPASGSTNQSLAELLALASSKTPHFSKDHVELSSASLKISRPNLVKALFSQRPNQCVTCGRRFPTGPEGKAQKDRHMDWHFRTNQRIQDASKGIQSRSWYIGELEWIRSKEVNEDGETAGAGEQTQTATTGHASIKESYVSVPSDPENNQPCPICQEAFETGFNQEIQDWVWLDAKKVGNKIYHASCFSDVKGGGPDLRERTATPDSVLGKRKAEGPFEGVSPAKRIASG